MSSRNKDVLLLRGFKMNKMFYVDTVSGKRGFISFTSIWRDDKYVYFIGYNGAIECQFSLDCPYLFSYDAQSIYDYKVEEKK